jgi:hypothetical protein
VRSRDVGPSDARSQAVEPNEYRVQLHRADLGWEVRILDPADRVAWKRSCADEAEARTLASTVSQHVYWLSSAKFREYYKFGEQA